MNYYLPCVDTNQMIRLTPHSDATGITLLVEINEVQGLQIKKDVKWVSIQPISGAIIVNIGDILEVFVGLLLPIKFLYLLVLTHLEHRQGGPSQNLVISFPGAMAEPSKSIPNHGTKPSWRNLEE